MELSNEPTLPTEGIGIVLEGGNLAAIASSNKILLLKHF